MISVSPPPMTPSTSPSVNAFDIPPEQFERVMELVAAIAATIPPKQLPRYLTVQEAATYCRVAVQTIYNNRRHIARMPGVRKLLFTREALDTWLATRHARRRKQK